MAREKDWLEEEQGCLNCGDLHYIPSKTPGLCKECNPVNKQQSPRK